MGAIKFGLRPGPGWKHLGGSVWEHTSSTRVHVLGLVRLPDKTYVSANNFPEYFEAHRMIKINGGNRKRGLMAWARTMLCRKERDGEISLEPTKGIYQ